jgi:hypothetical protein
MRMVRGFFVAVGLMLSAGLAQSQAIYANVTATVVDPNSHPLAGAVLTAILVDTTGRQVTSATSPNGQIVSTIVKPMVLDSTGAFAVQLLNTSTLSKPSGTQWKLNILPPPLETQAYILTFQPPWLLQYTSAINADIDLSSQLSALTSPITFINLQTGQNTLSSGGGGFPITLGSTSIAASSTTTSVDGLTVNGVDLSTTGPSTQYLDNTGAYSTPPGGSGTCPAANCIQTNSSTNQTIQQTNSGFGVQVKSTGPNIVGGLLQ